MGVRSSMLTVVTLLATVACLALLLMILLRPPDRSAVTNLDSLARAMREEARGSNAELRNEIAATISRGDAAAMSKLAEITKAQQTHMQILATRHDQMREEIGRTLQALSASLAGAVTQHGHTQRQDLERVRLQIQQLSEANEARLQAIRAAVDEKLQETLEKRLGDSFTRVAAQLEEVHKGLGEMRGLANGVGDLKRVLTNVKSRGVWGEVQLESLLEQMLSPEQFVRNAITREGTRECVEFAVKFPGRGELPLLLPVDAKFPIEDYQELVDACDRGDAAAVDAAARRLETSVKNSAKTIHEKYVNPPVTTDFAIMFLPTEGLYAEVLRRPGLAEHIQRTWGVLIAGPTTLTAILTSLQMGFRTLAIEKRSSEVWRVLEAVKAEFLKFGKVVDKVDNTLASARNHIESLRTRSRALSRNLKNVEQMPESEATLLLQLDPDFAELDEDDDESAAV
ncbi:MAG TPA: DNA recombination protein RmuC [Thermoanaerobaculia bacterium]